MTLREWLHRLWGTFRRSRTDRDLEDELQIHLELAADEERRRGTPDDGAVRAARLRVGAVAQATEAQRDQRGLRWLEDLMRDLRYASRMLARSPVFTLVSVLSLAIGIGANGAVFSFADALLLRPLGVPRPGEVVTVGSSLPPLQRTLVASYRDYVDIRDRSRSFNGLVAFTECSAALGVKAGSLPKPTIGLLVSGNFFSVLGVEPELGRAFRSDEDLVAGRHPVLVISHDLWERQFGADPAILGRMVRLSGVDFTVIGVAPRGFVGLDRYTHYEFYTPLAMWPRLESDRATRPLEMRDVRRLTIKGRLASDTTLAQAQTELSVIAKDLARAYQDTNRNTLLTVRTE